MFCEIKNYYFYFVFNLNCSWLLNRLIDYQFDICVNRNYNVNKDMEIMGEELYRINVLCINIYSFFYHEQFTKLIE